MQKLCNFLKNYFLPTSVLFLVFFVPLYPKFPLLDIVHTWVYIRLEDFVMATIFTVYLLVLVLERRLPRSFLMMPISVYWLAGGLSVIWSLVFIGPSLTSYFPQLV